MAEQKSWIELVLMPLAVTIVGTVGTYFVTQQQEKNAQIMSQSQLASTRQMAAADRQVKILEIFSEKITSNEQSQRILALRLLKAVDDDLAEKLAVAVSELEPKKSEVRRVAKEVAKEAATRRPHHISNITLDPISPAKLKKNEKVNVNFSYETDYPGKFRIFVRPFTKGSRAANYAAHPSPLYSKGQGDGKGYFTITRGSMKVDRLRIQIIAEGSRETIYEQFIEVDYQFS